jgi:hypothetical protein
MATIGTIILRRRGTSHEDRTMTTSLRIEPSSSRAPEVFCGPKLPNGTILEWRGFEQRDRNGDRWLYVGQRGVVDGWVRADHTMRAMVGHRSGGATYTDLRQTPSTRTNIYQGRIEDGMIVEVCDQRHADGYQWVNVREPRTGAHGWIKIEHLRTLTPGDFVQHRAMQHRAVGGGDIQHRAMQQRAMQHRAMQHRAVGGGDIQHRAMQQHAVGGGDIQHRAMQQHAVGGGGKRRGGKHRGGKNHGGKHHGGVVCPLTEQLHQAAVRASQHEPISQQDMALARQQMQGFRREQAQAEAMARAQAQARGMHMLGALGLPFGLQFMGM